MQVTISAIFSICKTFFNVKLPIESNGYGKNGCIFSFRKSATSYFIFKYKFGTKYQLSWSKVVFIKRFNEKKTLLQNRDFFEILMYSQRHRKHKKLSQQSLTEYLRDFYNLA